MRKIELLAPAGDMECLKSAVYFGADAVYLGGNEFGMRASPKNFTVEELREAVNFSHENGVKVYLTCNTTPTNSDIDKFREYIIEAEKTKIDAVIASDFGIISIIKKVCPTLEIHASTQVGIMNYATALYMKEIGIKRAVLARETSLTDISRIRDEIGEDMELEAFVHGAMCVSFSGRCLLSKYLINRDANRGECAQPCRWKYTLAEEKRKGLEFPFEEDENGAYILNARDLCMIEYIDDIIKSGVNSFKIEGRAKSAYYVAIITNAYRTAIDAALRGENLPLWVKDEVFAVSHREYSTGFYLGDEPEQYYKSSGYTRTRDFIGIVNGERDGKLFITQRNYFKVEDEIEIVAPREKPVKIKIRSLTNMKGEAITIANKATEELLLDCGMIFPPHSLIRKIV